MTAVVLFALSSALTWQLSKLLSVLSGAFVCFLAFGCPLWFMHVQESKNQSSSDRRVGITYLVIRSKLPSSRHSARLCVHGTVTATCHCDIQAARLHRLVRRFFFRTASGTGRGDAVTQKVSFCPQHTSSGATAAGARRRACSSSCA
uniref:Uncharacterized protein n=1 Tax=Hyaloperonospora arabidopsidis (strain Emoy2) TaxID=559515 RepID=M4B2I5_HYAAE